VAVFGLPPLAHEDDALRGVLCALDILAALHQLRLRPSIGVTTGQAFCGVVGSRARREYSVLVAITITITLSHHHHHHH
jgi:class 3 adenylate cyclase